jgi:hypothetical protein
MKFILWSLAALALLAPTRQAFADTVHGQVLHGISGFPQTGLEVAFLIRQEGGLNEIVRKETDAEGRFSFAGPFISPGLRFFLVAFYGGVPYPSAELEVGAQRGIVLEVYEPTEDPAALHLSTHSLFFSLKSAGIEVLHVAQIHNADQRTYAGKRVDGKRRATEFSLPAATFNLQNFSGTFSQDGPERFFDDRPLPPGDTQVAFTYFVDPEQLEGDYIHRTVYPTQVLEVLVQPISISLDPPFDDLGTVDFPNGQFRRFRLQNLEAGQSVPIPLPLGRSLRWSFKWIALLMAFAGLISLFFVPHRPQEHEPQEPTKVDTQNTQQEYQDLLKDIAQLDDDHTDNPQDAAYLVQRRRLMERSLSLGRILQRDQAGDGA